MDMDQASGRGKWLPVLLLAVMVLSVSCGPDGRKSRRRSSGPVPRIIVEQDSNGSQIDLVPGQEMVIQLVRNFRDNMVWVLVEDLDESVLEPIGQRTADPRASRGERYTRGVEEMRFKAISGGEVILDLAYIPVGGTLGQATNRFFLRVVVDRFQR
ncbi:MAG: hypothetical protein MK116_10245 [Phycisphaerales bacterium]|nr:hypothetical protein [Phycisphaerales bacterium]